LRAVAGWRGVALRAAPPAGAIFGPRNPNREPRRWTTYWFLHAESEGPGTLGDFLKTIGAGVHTAKLYAGQQLPDDVHGLAGIVIMGGPMSVHNERAYPFLRQEAALLRNAIAHRVPVLGVCLGAQMLAKACGASVGPAPQRELGWYDVRLTDTARPDPLFGTLPDTLRVFQWHEQTFTIPRGGVLLATSASCRNQAFRYGNAYGLQLHVEVTRDLLASWFAQSPDWPAFTSEFNRIGPELARHAEKIYAGFVSLMEAAGVVRRKQAPLA